MKKVYLLAYDNTNLGDDLFIHMITKRYPSVCFYIWTSETNRSTYSALPNVKILTSDIPWIHMLGKLSHNNIGRIKRFYESSADAVVNIGGSIFMEYSPWRNMLNWWRNVVENYPIYILGANFGPYSSEDYRAGFDAVFARAQDVCFRDHYSKNLFPDNPKVRYAPDILFALPIPAVKKKDKTAFFSVIDCEQKEEGGNHLGQYDAAYVHFMARHADAMIENGWDVVFSSFCGGEGDEKGIKKVLNAMCYPDRVRLCVYNGENANSVLQTLAESQCVYATRFHAAIIGFAAECKVIPVVYSDKTIHVLEDINYNGPLIDIRTINETTVSIEPTEIEYSGIDNLSELKEKSNDHFSILDNLLNSR